MATPRRCLCCIHHYSTGCGCGRRFLCLRRKWIMEIPPKVPWKTTTGKLVNDKISWRGDSGLKDGSEAKLDLSKGMYDAGDNLKFCFPMAFTDTVLSWDILEYEVGDPKEDHKCWEKPEKMNGKRPLKHLNTSLPGSMLQLKLLLLWLQRLWCLRKISNFQVPFLSMPSSFLLLKTSIKVLTPSLPEVAKYYNSTRYGAELIWGASWLYHATGDDLYLEYVTGENVENYGKADGPTWFSWDNKLAGAQVLLSSLSLLGDKGASGNSGLEDYKQAAEELMCAFLPDSPSATSSRTKSGLIWISEWDALQNPVGSAFLAALYSYYMRTENTDKLSCGDESFEHSDRRDFAKSQNDETTTKQTRVSWNSIYCPKLEGTLGLKDLLAWNNACLMHLIKSILMREGFLWVTWCYEYVMKGVNFLHMKVGGDERDENDGCEENEGIGEERSLGLGIENGELGIEAREVRERRELGITTEEEEMMHLLSEVERVVEPVHKEVDPVSSGNNKNSVGMTKKNQRQDETSPPKWWEIQENMITTMESRLTTNQGYVEEILKILTGRKEDQNQSADDQVQTLNSSNMSDRQPVKVTVVNDKTRFTYKPDEPGILKSKPADFSSFKNDNLMGENSAVRNQLVVVEGDKRGIGGSSNMSGVRLKFGLMVTLCKNIMLLGMSLRQTYVIGHQCKVKQLNMMMEEDIVLPSENSPAESKQTSMQEEESLEISMNAINGCIGHNTLRIQGTIQGRPLSILIDSGSTHSFLTPQWADAGKQVNTPYPLAITVANGQQLYSLARCNEVEWKMQGPILMNFNNMTLSFVHKGEHIIIQGQPQSNSLQQISGATLLKMTVSDSPILGHVVLFTMMEGSKSVPTAIQSLLDQYHCVFIEPTDYRKLNNMKVKDKFPIPVVEDLLDELHGAVYFSKIDLRSGYWQIIVKPEDIYKTTFRTHQGHYEFKTQVEYLGHIISASGVSTDPSKVAAMKDWPVPKSLKSLRGFLGLTGYYRRFIKGYDASSGGIRVVLSQDGRPIAYLSKALSPRHVALSIYEREYLAILLAASKWRHYLEGCPFVIKTDHEPLKYLLEQKLTTAIQKKGLTKLLGLDYTIQYRKGKSNVIADALSRQWEDQGQCLSMSTTLIIPSWVQEVEETYREDKLAVEWISILTVNPSVDPSGSILRAFSDFKIEFILGILVL
ncbi:cytokinin riboside 5'-monophosphate phosphoribohydrolase LOG3 isoform X1 [Hibiscus syriacus]|uniref:Cytokinin riboside 5'-monophosphate phosphoribohydrolase LOG3 isoform X1 n=1 Tax=Hibiscus syriacus TaxID=106335 RepID=A0A6A3BAP0_HIBSY|nr:cytokinin riboside 5'-monophosphate phosphoribohydrolase LOG3 isoform X1 [Hibiscus syriacus]